MSVTLAAASAAFAQGLAFTYQGRLNESGVDANGNFDFRFGLYTNTSTGSQIGNLETNANTAVSNGIFTTTLNFGAVFNGTPYWLEIGVRTNGSTNAFTILTPRQPITPAPYAITASNLSGILPATQLSGPLPASVLTGSFSNSVSFTNTNNIFAGNGGGLTNVFIPSRTNYLCLCDFTVQTFNAPTTYQNVTFNTLIADSGWTVASGSFFTVIQTGLYLVQYQMHIEYAGGGTTPLSAGARAILNPLTTPVEIAGSESVITTPAGGTVGLLSRSFLLPLNSGQSLSLQAAAGFAGGTSALFSGTFSGQSFPSVSLTVTRIQ
jgi:hypothetical protein